MRQTPTRVLILTRLSVLDAGVVAVARMRRRKVLCLRQDARARWIGAALAVTLLDTDSLPRVELSPSSYDEAMSTFAVRASAWTRGIDRECQAGLRNLDLDDFAIDILRVSLLQRAARHARGVFRCTTWLAASNTGAAVVRCDDAYERLVYESCLGTSGGVRVIARRTAGLSVVGKLVGRLRSRVVSSVERAGPPSGSGDSTPGVDVREHRAPGAARRVMLFLNYGLTYGSLYSYDFLLSDHLDSPASWKNAVVVSRHGGTLANGTASDPWPTSQLSLNAHLRIGTLVGKRPPMPRSAWRVVSEVIARAAQIQVSLEQSYPQLELAIFAFDAQVPAEYSLAFHFANVRTIAIHERPATAVTASVPIAVETLLTASAYFGEEIRARDVHAVKHTLPIGMWRTDLLVRGEATVQREERLRVLVLPFVLAESVEDASPFATTRGAVGTFLMDIACVAATRPDGDFIIRSKSIEWLTKGNFGEFFDEVARLPNLTLSVDYSALNTSYDLLAQSHLVIGKHTSLIDEALAAGIPCIVHDYANNASHYARFILQYIPEFAWAQSRTELVTKVSAILDDKGERFRADWNPLRAGVFGNPPDGRVRSRYAQAVCEILAQ